ncbi:MAG: glycosyltransferase family 4 protein [Limnochordia bacterium]
MKILHLTASASGGMSKYLFALLVGLKSKGYELLLAGPKDLPWDRRLDDIERINLSIGPQLGLRDLLQVVRLVSLLRREGITICHAHGYRAGLIAQLAGAVAGVRVIVTLHNYLPPGQSLSRCIYLTLQRFLLRRPVELVAVSKGVKNHLTHLLGLPKNRIQVIYPGLELPLTRGEEDSSIGVRQGLGFSTAQPVVITVARLIPAKGVQYLLQGVAQLNRRIPNLGLIICGDGPYKKILETLAHKLGLGSRVVFTGHRQDVLALVQAADVFVLPTLSEGLSLAILEAMALGKPVIASRVGGIPELITHGQAGLLVPPGSPRELAAALGKIFTAPLEGVNMGQRAKKRVLTEFTASRMVEAWDQLYQSELTAVAGEVVPFEAR